MDEDGGSTGSGAENNPAENESAGNADGQKTGEIDVEAKAQRIADAIVAKKLKGMPSKEEVSAFKKWQEEQKTEGQRIADKEAELNKKEEAIAKREAITAAKTYAMSAGVKPDHLEDAVILATAKAGDGDTIEEMIDKVVAANPSWKITAAPPEEGSNPAKDANDKVFEVKRHF